MALAGLIAAFMAGVAANVSAFNTVVTYDLWEPYVRSGQSDDYYLRVGRIATVVGILVGIGTALIASGYNNIMDYIQLLFSFFNAPLFATFIIGMFWRRMTPWAGFWGLVAGTAGAAVAHYGNKWGWFDLGSAQAAAFWGAIAAFVADAIVTVAVSLVTQPKPIEELQGLVYGMANVEEDEPAGERVWYRKPWLLGAGALGLVGRPEHRLHLAGGSDACPMQSPPGTRSSRSTRRPVEADAERARRAANLFDLRRIIGGLFAVYGVILVVLGLGASDAEIDKAAGWNLNLWVGVAMLVTAAIFLAWAFARPLGEEIVDDE